MDSDRELALLWEAEDNLKCGGCGHPIDESSSEASTSRDWHAESVQCLACAARARSEATVAKTLRGEDNGAMARTFRHWVTRARDRREH